MITCVLFVFAAQPHHRIHLRLHLTLLQAPRTALEGKLPLFGHL